MRDIVSIPLNAEQSLVIASDNSGAIGLKEHDEVKVPYEAVAYYGFRVAVMECVAAGGIPITVSMHNFCGEETWPALKRGVETGLEELGFSGVEITGSTESNFAMSQSAVGIVVVGLRKNQALPELVLSEDVKLAVIGSPLLGGEVIEFAHHIAPLTLFKWVCAQEEVEAVVPVGSKGIFYELQQLFAGQIIEMENVRVDADLLKSSGPATCFIVAYQGNAEEKLRWKTGELFHHLKISR